ncbi:hypothetical protein Rhopal_002576-T1 [Rhodotorula paludigena]|uniref:Guanine nucleotide-binding protein-like 1 n=1 Tax=Rhodotorula paludigena TaxID=86838 RepID=A0AAV5GG74_9BASI|nr:hypothetical protein Rhopal_002576-T1 [Rhodotorula paludigena]
MARKKPQSGKARKAQLQVKRAHKKANTAPVPFPADVVSTFSTASSSASAAAPSHAATRERIGHRFRTPEQRARDEQHAGRMALESRFIRLPKHVAEQHRQVAASDKLRRPVPDELGVLRPEDLMPQAAGGSSSLGVDGAQRTGDFVPAAGENSEVELTCPKRPKWRYDQTKKEVEKNEEGIFRKWLDATDEILARHTAPPLDEDGQPVGPAGSPTFFERNLNVWRQLWRTTETSDLLLVLVDVRFPLLHYPPSLRSYLRTLKPLKPVVLVLTKTDLVPRAVADAWKRYFEQLEGGDDGAGAQVVLMESYKEEERREETQGTHARLLPSALRSARHALLSALQRAHASLLAPPPVVASDPAKLARWKPRCRRVVDWEGVAEEGGETGVRAGTGRAAGEEEGGGKRRRGKGKGKGREEVYIPREVKSESEDDGEAEKEGEKGDGEEYPFLTVGLIGQPNVGKSSLLNALLAKKVVRASRTPGKTKTLQTIFWNATLRLCDCPGLVCPSSAGFERQVLAGVLPIQNVEPVLHFIGQRLPLEKVLRLKHHEEVLEEERDALDDEFSLESPEERRRGRQDKTRWTTDELLAAYAVQQGFITAKVGRPDIYRSGAYILRQLHSSIIPWAFRPPALDVAAEREGIWLKDFVPKAGAGGAAALEEDDGASEFDGEEDEGTEESGSEEDDSEEDDDSADEKAVQAVRGAFAALAVEGEDDHEDSDDEGDSEPDRSSGDGDEEESE